MKHYTKAITLSMLVVLLLVAVLPISAVKAEETVVDGFDSSSIYEDLNGATIQGKTFDINDYPANENGTPELLAFTEFAFSLKHEYQPYYGLYLYVYYPQGNLDDSELNTVEMANKYEDGQAVNWSKYALKLLDRDYNGVLYKFKIMDSTELEHTIADTYARVAMSSAERRYDINSIELHQKDAANAVDYGIGGSWTITGFDKGMHESSMEQSTLQSTATFQNTLKLDVHQTYFRSWRNLTDTLADQLSSVYFAVDNKIVNEYDQLYAIDFEAYKYLSSPIFCIYEKAGLFDGSIFVDYAQVYQNLLNQRGKSSAEVMKLKDYTWLGWDLQDTDMGAIANQYYASPLVGSTNNLDKLAWVFQTTKESDHIVATEQLLSYMSDFSTYFGRDVRGQYSSLLFSDHYYSLEMNYATRQNGVNIGRTIEATEEFELVGSLSNHTYWEKLALSFGFTKEDTISNFAPMQEVTYAEIKHLTDEEISQIYFVNETDVVEFKYYVKQQSEINKTVYLFRFDIDTFYTTELRAENLGKCGYVSQEPIYLDFDIISLTYDKADVKTVIPVVSNPIDIIAGIEPPTDGFELEMKELFSNLLTNFLTILFGVLAAALFILVMGRLVRYIFKNK